MKKSTRRVLKVVAVLVVVLAVLGGIGWYHLFRAEPLPEFQNDDQRFLYGSFGGEADNGFPYWLWYVLPRVFGDKLPGPGGYASFGFAWEEGHEVPAGFALRTVGFQRVTNNCALCHATRVRIRETSPVIVVPAGPSQSANVQAYLRFLIACADDAKFNADVLMPEIQRAHRLSFIDGLIYRYLLIPRTRAAIRELGGKFAWMNKPTAVAWGPGRNDPMNLTKYFLTSRPVDDTSGPADFPSAWALDLREGHRLQWDGSSPGPHTVVIDSGLGVGAPPDAASLERLGWIEKYLRRLRPPPFPKEFPIDDAKAAKGRAHFEAHCAACHSSKGAEVGKPMAVEKVGTDRRRFDTWDDKAAEEANRATAKIGVRRPDMSGPLGYVPDPLVGIWLRGPYLHNGSVPTLRALLDPAEKRPKRFWRGWDVIDPVGVGFRTDVPESERWRCVEFDATKDGDRNVGHEYGTGTLSDEEKDQLVEYLKTL